MVEAKRDESEDREPDAHELGGEIPPLGAYEDGHADEPVAADAAEEDVVEFWGELFLGGEGDDFGFVGVGGEDVAILTRSDLIGVWMR